MPQTETDRLTLRPPVEADRARFVELFTIAPENHASRGVADKVGFHWWRRIEWMDDPTEPTDLLVRSIGTGGPPLLAPW